MSGAWWDEPGVMQPDPNEVINLESDDENDNNMGTNNANNADNNAWAWEEESGHGDADMGGQGNNDENNTWWNNVEKEKTPKSNKLILKANNRGPFSSQNNQPQANGKTSLLSKGNGLLKRKKRQHDDEDNDTDMRNISANFQVGGSSSSSSNANGNISSGQNDRKAMLKQKLLDKKKNNNNKKTNLLPKISTINSHSNDLQNVRRMDSIASAVTPELLNWRPILPQEEMNKGIRGELDAMVNPDEIEFRQVTRQISPFEMMPHIMKYDPDAAGDPRLCTKKYQRSAADKEYPPESIRTVSALEKTSMFLFTDAIDLDITGDKGIFSPAINELSELEVHSYIKDRLHACRVDFQVQEPVVLYDARYLEYHERNLRCEILFSYLVRRADVSETKLDDKQLWQAISQCIDPLLKSYERWLNRETGSRTGAVTTVDSSMDEENAVHFFQNESEAIEEKVSIAHWPAMASMHCLIIASLVDNAAKLSEHLMRVPDVLIKHPAVSRVIDAVTAFQCGNHAEFLQRHLPKIDFLTAVACFY